VLEVFLDFGIGPGYYRPCTREGGLAVSKTYVETSTELLEGLDEMVREGYYANRTEGINDALRLLLRQYKLAKLHEKDSSTLGKHPTADEGARRE
jgi:Arc/MetJ-type ribon-helix-helix transcriptional regulator